MAALAAGAEALGADKAITTLILNANTAMEVSQIARKHGLPLAGRIAAQAREAALATLSGGINVDVAVFDRNGGLLANTAVSEP